MPWKTALDNVAVALEPKGVTRREAPKRAQRMAAPRRALGLRRPLPAHALRRPEQARRAGADADPRPRDPAHGRALRPARRADPADHGQPAARPLGRGPQGGAVRDPRPRGGDRAGRPGRRDVGRAGGRASSATFPCRCRARATSPRSGWSRASTSIHKEIWSQLRVEVQKAYAQGARDDGSGDPASPRPSSAAEFTLGPARGRTRGGSSG